MANFPAFFTRIVDDRSVRVNITPTARSFKPGIYPQRTYRALSGAVSRRTFGNNPYGASLSLEFDNVSDTVAVLILDHYRSQTAANRRFNLSSEVLAGMSSSLAYGASSAADNLRWEYAEPPDIESVSPGISRIRVTLAGEIRDPARDE